MVRPSRPASDLEAIAGAWCWPLAARPDQLAPRGDWSIWLVKAGRGWGKTRVGAEWVRSVATPGARIALVGSTAADVRDVMVEGESGILAVCEPWNRPLYEPSKRRLTWPNGAIATTYSAEEPDRLRGPQHSVAWCLAGDTPVLMSDGSEKPISRIRIGDMVQTRKGPRACIGSMLTKQNACVFRLSLVDGRSIIGTGDHPVWIDGVGFTPISSVTKGMMACVTPVLSGAASCGTDMAATMREHLGCIGRSGRLPMGRSQKVFTFTISMETRQTIGLKTLSCSPMASIVGCTPMRSLAQSGILLSGTRTRSCKKIDRGEPQSVCFTASSATVSSGAQPNIPPSSVRAGALSVQEAGRLSRSRDFASTAESNILRSRECRSTVQSDAITWRLNKDQQRSLSVTCHALTAERSSGPSGPTQSFVSIDAPLLFTLEVASVERLASRVDVYDIAVDGEPEFFANGILVHNCDEVAAWAAPDTWDMLLMGLRLGARPRAVVTTTPRTVPLMRAIQASPGLVVTRGSTRDNAANLAPSFLSSLMTRYEGTRLGRQELDGEELDDNPDALWSREAIDGLRVREVPELARVVVAIDPATTATASSDETGIVVAGLGVDGRGYVLADRSGRYKPDEWARRAVEAYHAHKADRIVAEGNQGGDMVTHVLRTAWPEAPVRIVHASRGKVARAEPVAALYEQGRVSHVGALPQLEDQMCSWTPGQASPDRMDALVWALTELMLGRGELAFA